MEASQQRRKDDPRREEKWEGKVAQRRSAEQAEKRGSMPSVESGVGRPSGSSSRCREDKGEQARRSEERSGHQGLANGPGGTGRGGASCNRSRRRCNRSRRRCCRCRLLRLDWGSGSCSSSAASSATAADLKSTIQHILYTQREWSERVTHAPGVPLPHHSPSSPPLPSPLHSLAFPGAQLSPLGQANGRKQGRSGTSRPLDTTTTRHFLLGRGSVSMPGYLSGTRGLDARVEFLWARWKTEQGGERKRGDKLRLGSGLIFSRWLTRNGTEEKGCSFLVGIILNPQMRKSWCWCRSGEHTEACYTIDSC
ncbi:uncharacterized protein LOC110207950 [Phascolarctos cinereus]|uniref:Uncharacterized protein LOC110207950 n=1 Tax=Phascolarctos cinereus TaxID=38626 RepID=A0A6P5K7F6_PHACI|nr:uncharacterized protein LOC110207950 [Phascolarctos cinereus]